MKVSVSVDIKGELEEQTLAANQREEDWRRNQLIWENKTPGTKNKNQKKDENE